MTQKERMQWFIITIATFVLILMVIASLFKENSDLNEVFLFFGSISALVLGAGIYNKISNGKEK